VLTESGKTYGWDTRNQLSQPPPTFPPLITRRDRGHASTDPFGRRTSKTVSGTQTGFLYDGVNCVQEKSERV